MRNIKDFWEDKTLKIQQKEVYKDSHLLQIGKNTIKNQQHQKMDHLNLMPL